MNVTAYFGQRDNPVNVTAFFGQRDNPSNVRLLKKLCSCLIVQIIDLKGSAREAVHFVTNLQYAISLKMSLFKFLRIVEALSVNKCSFGQRFTANKHATIRYIFKTSFFGVITLPGFVRVSRRVSQQPANVHHFFGIVGDFIESPAILWLLKKYAM